MKPTEIAISLSLIAAGACGAAAHAKEVPVDAMVCWGGVVQVIAPAEGTLMGTFQLTGTMQSAQPGGALDGSSVECMGTFKLIAGNYSHVDYCMTVDRDGDKTWALDIRNSDEDTTEYLGGTGKYAGTTGKLRKERPVQFARLRPGVTTGCARNIGTYTVP